MQLNQYASCIEACNRCANYCDRCSTACLKEDNVKDDGRVHPPRYGLRGNLSQRVLWSVAAITRSGSAGFAPSTTMLTASNVPMHASVAPRNAAGWPLNHCRPCSPKPGRGHPFPSSPHRCPRTPSHHRPGSRMRRKLANRGVPLFVLPKYL